MNQAYYDEAPAVIKDFLSYMETIRGKSKNTIHEYYYDLRLFFRFMKIHMGLEDARKDFEKIDIKDMDIELIRKITLSDIYSFMSFLSRERDNSSCSRARKVASIRSFFNYLTNKAKLLEQNPAAELESPKIMKRLPKYLNIEESKRLLGSVDGEHKERDFAIITLFLNCGLRLSELVNINLSNIKNDVLTVVGKGDKERTIYLNAACIKAIEAYLKVRPVEGVKDKNALFLSSRKQRISNKTVQHIVKKYIKAAGLDPERYSTHKLRHTAATLMYKHGNVDIRALQEILGHESIATTEIYTHVDSKQLKNALESNPLSNYVDENSDENES
ncbi:MAG TPA: tyrosine recombinase XerC [Acetivibrio sp.]|uniref:tyrosine recombinase XerC n=1 Tax=Acetivibrio sp. TaxID=1872092 RepID=UPI002C116D45|nr:tyrosine recombinase XerC [Acetivibrio sp.]HOM01746.1 tyrosine recombinase XerC [Acetivibrio sp.]